MFKSEKKTMELLERIIENQEKMIKEISSIKGFPANTGNEKTVDPYEDYRAPNGLFTRSKIRISKEG